jgi:NADH-quinone oxidoreductase subunit G
MPRPKRFRKALKKAEFVVALEVRESEVTRLADVVLPVAPAVEKAGMFVNWEGRVRPFPKVLDKPESLPDLRALAGIAEEMGRPLGFRTTEQARAEMMQLGPWDGARPEPPTVEAAAGSAGPDELVLASWKQMIDDGRMQDGDLYYKATARPPVVLVNAAHLARLGVEEGALVSLNGPKGSVQLPVGVADLADGVVWAPASAPGASVRHLVGPAGSRVTVTSENFGGIS